MKSLNIGEKGRATCQAATILPPISSQCPICLGIRIASLPRAEPRRVDLGLQVSLRVV